MSKITISGLSSSIFCSPSLPFLALWITSRSGSALMASPIILRIRNESSTIKTRIFLWLIFYTPLNREEDAKAQNFSLEFFASSRTFFRDFAVFLLKIFLVKLLGFIGYFLEDIAVRG